MDEQWEEELAKFSKMVQSQKIIWLSRLLFFVSMFARDTYQVGTDYVEQPEKIRKYNELLHRIASYQLEIAINKEVRKPDQQFFLMLAAAIDEVGINVSTLVGVMESR